MKEISNKVRGITGANSASRSSSSRMFDPKPVSDRVVVGRYLDVLRMPRSCLLWLPSDRDNSSRSRRTRRGRRPLRVSTTFPTRKTKLLHPLTSPRNRKIIPCQTRTQEHMLPSVSSHRPTSVAPVVAVCSQSDRLHSAIETRRYRNRSFVLRSGDTGNSLRPPHISYRVTHLSLRDEKVSVSVMYHECIRSFRRTMQRWNTAYHEVFVEGRATRPGDEVVRGRRGRATRPGDEVGRGRRGRARRSGGRLASRRKARRRRPGDEGSRQGEEGGDKDRKDQFQSQVI